MAEINHCGNSQFSKGFGIKIQVKMKKIDVAVKFQNSCQKLHLLIFELM